VGTAAGVGNAEVDAITVRSGKEAVDCAGACGAASPAGAARRASAGDFALAIPLAIAVCGHGSGASAGPAAATIGAAAGFDPASRFAVADTTRPASGASAPLRLAAAVRVFDLSALAERAGARAASRVAPCSGAGDRGFADATPDGLPTATLVRVRGHSPFIVFPAFAETDGAADGTSGTRFAATAGERAGVVDAGSGGRAVSPSRCSGAGTAG